MKYALKFPEGKLQGKICLPSSKSISNRLLIIRELSACKFNIENLSDSDDTKFLQQGMQSASEIVDIEHAGTAMRFITAYFAATNQTKTITGSERMKNRPIGDLIDALNQLGAEIKYLEKFGCPPVRTSGKQLSGNIIDISGDTSSQFISAMLLIAPVLPNGLRLQIKGDVLVSMPYIKMTLDLMKQTGIEYTLSNNTIIVPRQEYRSNDIDVERDRSAASYWYQMAILANNVEILLEGLTKDSLQGDAIIEQLSQMFGINTEYLSQGGAILTKQKSSCKMLDYNFIDIPDLIQTMAVTCCLSNTCFRFAGAQTLRVKETNRIAALKNELLKLGFCLKETAHDVIAWDGEKTLPQKQPISIATYNDHRMAMAFAPAAMMFPKLQIENPDVVSKSYPKFWDELKNVGVEICTC